MVVSSPFRTFAQAHSGLFGQLPKAVSRKFSIGSLASNPKATCKGQQNDFCNVFGCFDNNNDFCDVFDCFGFVGAPADLEFEQDIGDTGDVTLNTNVSSTGDNSSQTVAPLQIGNTGNLQNAQGFVQFGSMADDIEFEGSSFSFTPTLTNAKFDSRKLDGRLIKMLGVLKTR